MLKKEWVESLGLCTGRLEKKMHTTGIAAPLVQKGEKSCGSWTNSQAEKCRSESQWKTVMAS